eukprot:CAMPEP_0119503686 /NCGR_PEP_ID=MMETSP1344-20130328/24786_1 /TAXON_ID=236787 /ORGANISM="Florenciella parvula, Strain CCMP2471" /LENGTH=46 /DNA_ID= /DNA_START= /DNA_END= /DNA_ORIENTATION=
MGTTTLVSALLLLAGANGLQRAQPSATSRRFRPRGLTMMARRPDGG